MAHMLCIPSDGSEHVQTSCETVSAIETINTSGTVYVVIKRTFAEIDTSPQCMGSMLTRSASHSDMTQSLITSIGPGTMVDELETCPILTGLSV